MGKLYSTITRVVSNIVGVVAPGAAIKYSQRRQALATYAGASKSGPNRAWLPANKSADEIIRTDHQLLRARARSLIRDSSHLSGAIRKITNNVIYKGIEPQPKLKTSAGELREAQNTRASNAWERWAEAVNFYEKEQLVMRHLWQDGELFVHFYFDESLLQQGIIPLGIELLECDHLDTSVSKIMSQSNTKQGIEYDEQGRARAYWLFPEHPGESQWIAWHGSERYPAEVVQHIFLRDRISQNRGVPWLSPIIMEMRDYYEYQSSERTAARLAAAFGIFVTTPYPEAIGDGSPIGGDGSEVTGEDVPDYLESGRIQQLPAGWDIRVAENKRPGSNYESFVKNMLKGGSTGLGMSYEAFSNDYTDASYASARSASLEERRGYQVQQKILTKMFHQECWDRLLRMNSLARVESLPKEMPVTWLLPGWPWVDPDKDSKAAERDIKNGLNSRHRVIQERGGNYQDILEDLQQEKEDGFVPPETEKESNDAASDSE